MWYIGFRLCIKNIAEYYLLSTKTHFKPFFQIERRFIFSSYTMCYVFIHCRSCKGGLGSDSENFSLRFFGYFAKENFLQSFFCKFFSFYVFGHHGPGNILYVLIMITAYPLFNFTILQFLINCVKERLLWFDNGLLLSS